MNDVAYLPLESGFSLLGGIIPGNDNLQDLLTQIALSEQDRFQSCDRIPFVRDSEPLGGFVPILPETEEHMQLFSPIL